MGMAAGIKGIEYYPMTAGVSKVAVEVDSNGNVIITITSYSKTYKRVLSPENSYDDARVKRDID
jgi:hypothetical protein